MPAIPIIGAVAAVGGVAVAAKGLSNAQKAAEAAKNAPTPQVNIAETDAQARRIALQNAIDSAALEERFNPGAAQLRQGGLEAVLAALNAPTEQRDSLAARIAQQAGQPLSVGGPQSVTAASYDSPLLRAAIDAGRADLALGGQLPQDVRNLVVRGALARSGTVTGGLNLGRDLSTRDLGLTSLDLQRQRLAQAAALGQAEASLGQGNASLAQQAALANAGFAQQNDAMRLSADQYARQNLLQSGDFLSQLTNGDFSRALAAAQLGQNIAQPMSGLDPGSVANLAIGNVNAQSGKQQQTFAAQSGAANAMTGFGSQLAGTGLGLAANFYKPAPTVQPYTPFYQPAGTNSFIQSKNIFGP